MPASNQPAPAGAGRKILKRFIFILIALALFLVLFEAALQLAGVFLARLRESPIRPGAKVIVCIGDSNTYGLYVKAEEAYPAQLERLLQKDGKNYQALNLGAPGQNSSEILEALPGIFKKYHPAALVVMVGVNNRWNVAGQNEDRFRKFWYNLKLYKLASLLYYQGLKKDSNWVVRRRDTGEIMVHRGRDYLVTDEKELRDIQRRFIQDLVKMVEFCREHDAKIFLMTYAGDKEHSYPVPNGLTRQVAEKMQAPLADNYALFESRLYSADGAFNQKLRDEVLFADMHPKPPGYGWIAENLYELMKKNGLFQ